MVKCDNGWLRSKYFHDNFGHFIVACDYAVGNINTFPVYLTATNLDASLTTKPIQLYDQKMKFSIRIINFNYKI